MFWQLFKVFWKEREIKKPYWKPWSRKYAQHPKHLRVYRRAAMDQTAKYKILQKLQERNRREIDGYAELIHARKIFCYLVPWIIASVDLMCLSHWCAYPTPRDQDSNFVIFVTPSSLLDASNKIDYLSATLNMAHMKSLFIDLTTSELRLVQLQHL